MDTGRKRNNPNPREEANPISVLLFWWTVPLFKKGYRKELVEEDLYNPLKTDASEYLGDKLETQWERQLKFTRQSGKKKPSLLKALALTFPWEYTKLGIFHAVNDLGIRLIQPIILGWFLGYFKPESDTRKEDAYLFAGAIVLLTMLSMLMFNHFTVGAFHIGMRVRAACCSLIYRKSLRLSRTALGETAAGKVVNLLSNDVSRFDMVSIFLHAMWTAPLSAVIITYFLFVNAGYSGLIGIGIVFLIVPLQSYTGRLTSIYRERTAIRTDERVRLMDEIISGIQVIKMYVWEKPFAKMVSLARKSELKEVIKTSYIRGLFMTFQITTTRIAMFGTLAAMVLFGNKLSADKVFVFQAYFTALAFSMSMQFVRGVAEIAETLVSIKRLEEFLMLEEFQENNSEGHNAITRENGKDGVILKHITAKWIASVKDDTLKCIDLRVKRGELIAIIGQVGSGKSSLLQTILGELTLSSGFININGKISYACQEPWVFASTIRQNIVFGRTFDSKRYNEVIRVCALERDFKQFPYGDLTFVGERGSSLSGGQKARINLARAIYNEADVYLLDDPLSAVDTHVGKHLFNDCITSYLANKTRILVTHQLQYLRDANHIVIINDGAIEVQGSFQELLGSQVDFAQLLGLDESADLAVEDKPESERMVGGPISNLLRQISRASIRSKSSNKTVREKDNEETEAPVNVEASTKGTLKHSVYIEYFRSGANMCVVSVIGVMFLLAQTAASAVDWWMAYWVTQEELRTLYEREISLVTHTMGDNSTFGREHHSSLQEMLSTYTYLYIYTGIVTTLFIITITRSFIFYTFCMRCSSILHNSMFSSIIHTSMRFFDTNPSGRIMNRFSKDMGSVDELLPKAIMDASQIILMMAGSLVVAVSVNLFFLILIVVMGLFFWFIRKIYLKTSKNVKRLEGITKSPVFTHLNATLQGLTTIRAYGAQNILRSEFDRHQDLHSSAWYMFITTSQAFGFSLDLMCLIFIALVTFSFLLVEDTLGGNVGLAITQSLALVGMMQWGMRQSAEVANQMMSVERVVSYKYIPEEPLLETPQGTNIPRGWPSEGRIEFEKLYLRYGESGEPSAIKNLNITIQSKEKVGVVGRTGAGKSSLIAALFRLANVEGTIRIDGLDTATVGLHQLRKHISIIPQDPVLFSGTLRRNIDPFDMYPDYMLWRALDDVELKDSINDPLGLDMHVAERGSNFSVGQRQLVCLARAILRSNKILMLDEATANVDPQTDSLIQRTIRTKFADCTVLTVAHRLNTIMDSDKVLVMAFGTMVEFDHPHILLQNEEGHFYSMVQETGHIMAEQLSRIAEECYHTKKKET
ncbi:Multidrug resistance-associated protein 4 [Cryptotermes secundus]|uniref:Multidrug resistance-associated protein 4 n=2 Tax=Cryptotermes secundus TaxID=105785 RepID=A0A2J7PVQ7_9NEOP|nr:multidrug resistance-associated protein 4-like [Cryptotermes secundus]PNF20422.1 Multidrug resistance-associated protein 4 [Cryptotermes secundus]